MVYLGHIYSSSLTWALLPEHHAAHFHCWRKSQLKNKPLLVICLWEAVFGNRTLHPFPFAEWKSLFSQNTAAHRLSFLLKVHLNGGNFFTFRASLLCGNAGQSQHFDIIFEKDLSPAFRIIFRIENRMIFVAFRPKNCFDPFCKFLPSENWCTIWHRHYICI